MENELRNIIQEVLVKKKKNQFTFLTGAGLSAESGIPTYRGSGGIWVKGTKYHKPQEFGTRKYFKQNQKEVWQFTLVRKKMIENVEPNESHKLLFKIESLLEDKLNLITQNIDNLHSRAGSKNVYEIHGTYKEVKCINRCKSILPFPEDVKGKELKEDIADEEIELLKCQECGDWLRPNVLWFDEIYDDRTNKLNAVLKVAKNTGALFVLGTSGATNLPIEIARIAQHYGAYIIDVNLEDNYFTGLIEDSKRKLIVRDKTTPFLRTTYQLIKEMKKAHNNM